MIKLNENFSGGSYSFSVKNQVIDLIYPFVLGCLKDEEIINAYNDFKCSEIFPWKLFGKYQNLVSLLPIILDLENPPEELREKIINQLKNPKEEIDSSTLQTNSIVDESRMEEIEPQDETTEHGETETIENSEDIVLTLHHKEENDEAGGRDVQKY